MPLKLEDGYLKGFVSQHEYGAMEPLVKAAHQQLTDKTGLGNDFLAGLRCPPIMTRKSLRASSCGQEDPRQFRCVRGYRHRRFLSGGPRSH